MVWCPLCGPVRDSVRARPGFDPLRDLVVVLVGGEQSLGVAALGGVDFEHPPVAVRVLVDELGAVEQLLVDGDDLAGYRCVQV
ncbi:hypothetical protein FK85_30870 [Halorubrum saccharovorum]|uniref:Uncharacterized protein n=1 Tax=Halorubrum saccharovorum TaxID=2248 RepID=A0A0F8AUC6_9EURY|nr:hypothetical protein FK85_30870 [Halorubrum saccharovorum]